MTVSNKIYFLLLLLTLACYLTKLDRKEKYIKWIVTLLSFWLLTALPAVLLAEYGIIANNLFIYHIIVPVEFTILMLLFRDYVASTTAKKIIFFIIPAFITFSVLFSLFIQKVNINGSYAVITESLILIIMSLYFLRETAVLQQVKVMQRYPMFWISVGILFCYTGTLFIEGMLNYLIDTSTALAEKLYSISYISNYILLCFFIIGLFCDKILIGSGKQKIQ